MCCLSLKGRNSTPPCLLSQLFPGCRPCCAHTVTLPLRCCTSNKTFGVAAVTRPCRRLRRQLDLRAARHGNKRHGLLLDALQFVQGVLLANASPNEQPSGVQQAAGERHVRHLAKRCPSLSPLQRLSWLGRACLSGFAAALVPQRRSTLVWCLPAERVARFEGSWAQRQPVRLLETLLEAAQIAQGARLSQTFASKAQQAAGARPIESH